MPKLKEFITGLAKKAGFDTESATAKPFFDALPDTEVPDEIQKGIDNSLISMTDAKNNHPEIKNLYVKQSLDGVDKVLNDLLAEYELDENDKNEIAGIRSTYQRIPALTKKIAELITKKSAADPKDKKAIQTEIDNLHLAVKAEKDGRVADRKSFDDQMLSYKIKARIDSALSAFKTIHDELDPDVKSTVINTLLQKELQDNQAKFAFDDQGTFTLLKNDGTNYYGENHQQITPVKFIEQTLAKTKQLKVSSPAPVNGANNQRGNQMPQNANGMPDKNPNAAVIGLNNEALEALKVAAANNGKY